MRKLNFMATAILTTLCFMTPVAYNARKKMEEREKMLISFSFLFSFLSRPKRDDGNDKGRSSRLDFTIGFPVYRSDTHFGA